MNNMSAIPLRRLAGRGWPFPSESPTFYGRFSSAVLHNRPPGCKRSRSWSNANGSARSFSTVYIVTGGPKQNSKTKPDSSLSSVSSATGSSLLHLMDSSNASTRRLSASAQPLEDEEEDDPFLNSNLVRPRLLALRELLEVERMSEKGVIPATKFVSSATNSRDDKQVQAKGDRSSTKKKPRPVATLTPKENETSSTVNMEKLRRWVDALPEISESSHVLTDRFHRQHTYLRLSLTERCNLRCTYCMPENGVPLQPESHLLQTPELLQLAQYFRNQGVTKFRLTGGEPTLRKDLLDIVKGLQALNPQKIGMTTNGIVLASKLPALVDAGLSCINLSLDTLEEDKFATLTRRPGKYLTKVWESLEALQNLATTTGISFKLNCVVMRDVNMNEIADFVHLTQDFPDLQVRFIEYMPFTQNGWNGHQLVPYEELLRNLKNNNGIELSPLASDDPSDTTKWFQTPWAPGNKSRNVGFITSMTNHFCGTCNRLRLTADGQLKVCLFDGKTELSLRDALRAGFTDAELSKVIHAVVQQKHYKLGGHVDPTALAADVDTNRPMTLIGG